MTERPDPAGDHDVPHDESGSAQMRVDVVAAPLRYRRTPLVLLLLIALIPTAGLFVLQGWLDDQADRYEASRGAVEALETDTDDLLPGGSNPATAAAAATETPVVDFRRVPAAIAQSANALRLEAAVSPLYGFMNETSCAAVYVDGVPVTFHNPDIAVIPASTVKLMVAAVALEVLGSDHTFVTSVQAPVAEEDVIDGDLYLIGGGDPMLTSDEFVDSDGPVAPATSFDLLADALVEAGVERITGTVIGDGSRYDDEFVIEAWADGVAFDDAGPYDALMANDARVVGRRGPESDPNVAAAREFVRLLGDRGIRVDGGWDSGEVPSGLPVVGSVESAPLSDIVASMLTTSDNNTAELLVKEIGVADSGEGTRAAGLTAIDRTLRMWGVAMDGVRLLDGSGLDAASTVTCRALVAVLQHSRGTALPSGLPRAARTGTLADEFVDSPMAGRLDAKTGTLGNPPIDRPPLASKALAGYVTLSNGDTLEFAIVVNADEIPVEAYRGLWAAFGTRFDTYPSGPAPDELAPL